MANETESSNTDPINDQELNKAKTSRQTRLSPIWVVPIVAIAIGLWLVYDNYASRGTQVTLTMESAEGIEAGNTLIRSRNVEVGRVQSVRLSDDLSHAVLTARIQPEVEDLLREDTRFWVVKPRIGREGISGLGTVLSGAYIQLEPGTEEAPRREFPVSDIPPVAPAGQAGLRLSLTSQLGNSLRVGDPVSYQGYTVGRIEENSFEPESRTMQHQLFIEEPYTDLVTDSTRFWTSSGVDFRLDADGVRVNVESLEALLGGGVTFGVPEDLPMGQPVEANTRFTLYADEDAAREGTFNRYLEYVLLVDETVRGLSKGAPVEFRGVRMGTVAAVPWNFTAPQPDSRARFAIPVLIRVEPQRLGIENSDIDLEEWKARFQRMFGLGLRASLKSGSLLTGALFVDLNFHRDLADEYVAERFSDRDVFPTVAGGFAQIQAQVTDLLEKLNALEVEPLLTGLDSNLQASESMLNEVRDVSASLNQLLNDPETQAVGGNLNATLEELRSTLQGLSPSSPAYQELTTAIERLDRLMRDLQPLTRTLNDNPRALLFDNLDAQDPIPRAPRD
ncbi:intermembrane transport protein PqiB [Halomonas sp. ATBC28]|uniref:Paraquat-inducible protein B n=1 Tax=Vreelandella titanicae TaxID=664683 RepID=A0AAP9NKG9_9GAMM|nr:MULTISPECIES: intermembrane transport protein PqiB [Halomonas]UEQ02082.1 intermembrane transport protein PqiB [Halomonas profundus]QKS23702.1 Paraquat-inducible protein B [Halomonas titanicae]TMU14955.1 intermembrane transport protein PqiB [Halomonas sp. ATBC28]CDG55050.1 Paraquat-inducible protein B [Halomonas sp. A3H3]SDI61806.1 paraquat-inducible protein B [Halomonas titanicae]|tara:strand:+ start:2159 stop:3844 length:1686 start_codon:yes stop_codon:yes gene_type:complete